MKKLAAVFLISALCLLGACSKNEGAGCFVGAFLADVPARQDLESFRENYGKKPFVVMVFLDWGKEIDQRVIQDVYGQDSVLMVTWEPWDAISKEGIDYEALAEGKFDAYIQKFAQKLKAIGKPVFLRLAHEMNGDWYPWAGQKIGPSTYQKIFRHVHSIFGQEGAANVRWVFSINAENVPPENDYILCYPGSRYVDYIGLDGYNWGTTQPWSQWKSFREIFSGVYHEVVKRYGKPVIISEFSSTSSGGDKARWIREALREIKSMPAVRGWILFNINKETDWAFPPASEGGQNFKKGLEDPYFKEISDGSL